MRFVPAFFSIMALIIAGFSASAYADDDAWFVGSRSGTNLFAAPSAASQVIRRLPEHTDVRLLNRRSPWWYIETTGQNPVQGWVLEGAMRQRLQQNRWQSGKSSFFSSFAHWFRSDNAYQQTAVLGVRGLDEGGDQHQKAVTVNMDAVNWMETLVIDRREVDAFIAEGRLKP